MNQNLGAVKADNKLWLECLMCFYYLVEYPALKYMCVLIDNFAKNQDFALTLRTKQHAPDHRRRMKIVSVVYTVRNAIRALLHIRVCVCVYTPRKNTEESIHSSQHLLFKITPTQNKNKKNIIISLFQLRDLHRNLLNFSRMLSTFRRAIFEN